jgi:hypothetical protein
VDEDVELDRIDRREAVAGLSVIGALSLAVAATLGLRIINSREAAAPIVGSAQPLATTAEVDDSLAHSDGGEPTSREVSPSQAILPTGFDGAVPPTTLRGSPDSPTLPPSGRTAQPRFIAPGESAEDGGRVE